jgi:hypothetical protein
VTKKKRPGKRKAGAAPNRKSPTLPSAVTITAKRLEKLAEDLEHASKEAVAVADIVREDLAQELTKHLGNGNAQKKGAAAT